jgi:hypothetical protein
VLAARGDAGKGLALLRAALEKIEAPRDRALAACLLGRAETRRGNVEEGRSCFEIARKLDPACVLLEKRLD